MINTLITQLETLQLPADQRFRRPDWLGALTAFVLTLSLFIFTSLTSVEIFFWVFFFSLFWWRIDGRVSIAGALFFLVLIPLCLSLYRYAEWHSGEAWAELLAVWVFYFLAIGVLKQVWELATSPEDVRDEVTPPALSPRRVTLPVPSYLATDTPVSPAHTTPAPPPRQYQDIKKL